VGTGVLGVLGVLGVGVPGASLAWRTEVTSTLRPDVRQLVVVDAARGTVLLSVDQIADGKSRTVCDAKNVRGAGVPCTSPVRKETGAASAVADVEDAFQLAGAVYDYYKTSFGRDSIDGAGMPIVSTVRYCDPDVSTSCPYDNAFWDGTQMVYGAGFASADDVVAHELTHGVTEKTSGLFYFYESGAINESISDIFGEYVDQRFATLTPDTAGTKWLLGEDLPASIGVIRDMKNPPAFGQPDTTDSPLFLSGTGQYGADGDSGAVHTNSGVGNKFAYLLTDGGIVRDVTVVGLGRAKAQTIIYAATQRLTSAADYQAFASALKLGCSSVVGTAGITKTDCAQVAKAIAATKMDVAPPARGFAAAPAACVNHPGLEATGVFSDNFEDSTSATWDRIGFYYADQDNPFSSLGWVPKYATSGKNNVWGDDSSNPNSEMTLALHNPITVPANGYLKFKHAFSFDSDLGPTPDQFYDGGLVEYQVAGSDTWTTLSDTNGVNGYNGTLVGTGTNKHAGETAFVYTSRGYQTSLFDLAPLAGQDVRLRFTLTTDESFGSYGWFIDDVSVGGCAPPETTKPVLKVGTLSTVSITSPVVTATATDASGIAGYVVKRRWAGPRVGFTAWTAGSFRAGRTLRWVEPYVEGRTTCFSIQAKDTKGNLSAAQQRCTTSPWDDYKLTRSAGGWTLASSASAYDSTLSVSKKTGSTLVVTGVSGTSLVVLARKGVGAGTISVWVGKTRKAVFSLAAGSTVQKVRLPVTTGAFTGAAITIKVDSPGTAGVAVDGLAIRRA